jgi:hypothetical protein
MTFTKSMESGSGANFPAANNAHAHDKTIWTMRQLVLGLALVGSFSLLAGCNTQQSRPYPSDMAQNASGTSEYRADSHGSFTSVVWEKGSTHSGLRGSAANTAADVPGYVYRPGSFAAIMSVKSPGVYRPYAPAADPSYDDAPAPAASLRTLLAAKWAAVYGQHTVVAAEAPAQMLASTCWPGSSAAVMSAKMSPNARPGSAQLYKDCH